MPSINRAYWQERVDHGGSTWSENRWLDWEHGVVARAVFDRIWPDDLHSTELASIGRSTSRRFPHVLDVGAGDGRWSAWMADHYDVDVLATDELDWKPAAHTLSDLAGYVIADGQQVGAKKQIRAFRPKAVVFMNSLTCMSEWNAALISASTLDPEYVIVFDNLMYPIPPWAKNMTHRVAISWPEIEQAMLLLGYRRVAASGGDVLHRKWFLHTPSWLHPVVAVVSAGIDRVAGRILPFHRCRHIGLAFKRAY